MRRARILLFFFTKIAQSLRAAHAQQQIRIAFESADRSARLFGGCKHLHSLDLAISGENIHKDSCCSPTCRTGALRAQLVEALLNRRCSAHPIRSLPNYGLVERFLKKTGENWPILKFQAVRLRANPLIYARVNPGLAADKCVRHVLPKIVYSL